jgi:hypothetical protein
MSISPSENLFASAITPLLSSIKSAICACPGAEETKRRVPRPLPSRGGLPSLPGHGSHRESEPAH